MAKTTRLRDVRRTADALWVCEGFIVRGVHVPIARTRCNSARVRTGKEARVNGATTPNLALSLPGLSPQTDISASTRIAGGSFCRQGDPETGQRPTPGAMNQTHTAATAAMAFPSATQRAVSEESERTPQHSYSTVASAQTARHHRARCRTAIIACGRSGTRYTHSAPQTLAFHSHSRSLGAP